MAPQQISSVVVVARTNWTRDGGGGFSDINKICNLLKPNEFALHNTPTLPEAQRWLKQFSKGIAKFSNSLSLLNIECSKSLISSLKSCKMQIPFFTHFPKHFDTLWYCTAF